MGNARDFFSAGSWLKAGDIGPDEYDEVVATITEVEEGTQKDQKTGEERRQLILHFKQFEGKKFGLNNTNLGAVIDMFGEDFDEWVGRKLILFTMNVKSPSGMSYGIRVKAVKTKAGAAAAAPAGETLDDSDVPF